MGLNGERDVLRKMKIFIWRDRVSAWHPNDFPLSTRSARRHDGHAVLPATTLASLSHARTKGTAESGIPPPAAEAAASLYQDKTAPKRRVEGGCGGW